MTPRGSSTVDYGLVSPTLFDKIKDFLVGDIIPPVSDHAPITLSLQVNVQISIMPSSADLLSKPDKLEWNRELANRFRVPLVRKY